MPSQTEKIGLPVYNATNDKTVNFMDFRQSLAGDTNSAFTIIDTEIGVIKEEANIHKSSSNPHCTTKEDVGLENVPNYGASTKAQAEAGLDDGSLMTPKKTADAIKALSTGGSGGANLFISTKNEYQYISDVATSTIQLPILNFNPEIETIELYLNGARLIKGENFNLVNGVINLAFELGVNKPLNYVTYKTGYHYSDLVGAPDVASEIEIHNSNDGSHPSIVAQLNENERDKVNRVGGDFSHLLANPAKEGFPNNINSDDMNYINQRIFSYRVGENNGLHVFGDRGMNARRFGIQAGHAHAVYATADGILELNPFGGEVRSNGKQVATTERGQVFEATLQNGWTGSLKYSKNDLNQITLLGSIGTGTTAWSTTIATIPTSHTPLYSTPIIVYDTTTGNSIAGIVLLPSGEMKIHNPAVTEKQLITGNRINFTQIMRGR